MTFEFAADVLMKTTAALVLAWLVALSLRGASAALRHAVWAAGILASPSPSKS